jgi:hypothetical protein
VAGFGVAEGLAAEDVAAAERDVTVEGAAPVDALAIVRPRASVAPRAPAPTAVPMSGRLIFTVFSLRIGIRGAAAPRRRNLSGPHA